MADIRLLLFNFMIIPVSHDTLVAVKNASLPTLFFPFIAKNVWHDAYLIHEADIAEYNKPQKQKWTVWIGAIGALIAMNLSRVVSFKIWAVNPFMFGSNSIVRFLVVFCSLLSVFLIYFLVARWVAIVSFRLAYKKPLTKIESGQLYKIKGGNTGKYRFIKILWLFSILSLGAISLFDMNAKIIYPILDSLWLTAIVTFMGLFASAIPLTHYEKMEVKA
ncbi:MAG: hypothetical protein LBI13_07395 [Streptococcaceae bacterium]|nr:hypothetical protein [Streptococcaceae bacterium]